MKWGLAAVWILLFVVERNYCAGNPISSSATTTICNGDLQGSSGIISYKVGQNFTAHERCIWTVTANLFKNVRILVVEHGFHSNDAIQVLYINPVATVGADKVLRGGKLSATETEITVPGPVVYLFFQTDGSTDGTGFSLLWEGIGDSFNESERCIETLTVDDKTNRTGLVEYNRANPNCTRAIYSVAFSVVYFTGFKLEVSDYSRGYGHVSYTPDKEISVYELDTVFSPFLLARYGRSDPGPFTVGSPYPILFVFVTSPGQASHGNQTFNLNWGR